MRLRERNKDKSEDIQEPVKTGFRGNTFRFDTPEGWQDMTVYTIAGPVEDDMQHNIVVNIAYDLDADSVTTLGKLQIETLEAQLQGLRILKHGEITLNNGQEAYEVIFRWEPTNYGKLYQKQIYVLSGKTAYTLTTTFTRKTRKTKGPLINRIMMSFELDEGDE